MMANPCRCIGPAIALARAGRSRFVFSTKPEGLADELRERLLVWLLARLLAKPLRSDLVVQEIERNDAIDTKVGLRCSPEKNGI